MAKIVKVDSVLKSLLGKVFDRFLKFINWIALGYDGQLPCVG